MQLPGDFLAPATLPRRRRRRARIEIIPMIDTIFFLLVFFIIFSLSLTRQTGIGIEAPQGGSPLAESRQVVIAIYPEGSVLVNGQPVVKEGLAARLEEALRTHPDSLTVVMADREVPHGRVVQVMEMARNVGAKRFAIGTMEKGSRGDQRPVGQPIH